MMKFLPICMLFMIGTVTAGNTVLTSDKIRNAKGRIAELKAAHNRAHKETQALYDRIHKTADTLKAAQADHERLKKDEAFLNRQIHFASVNERSFILRKQASDKTQEHILQEHVDLKQNVDDINQSDIQMELHQRQYIQRLLITRFLWQIEIETVRRDKQIKQLTEIGAVLITSAIIYTSGGSMSIFGNGIRWYIQSKLENVVIDHCLKAAVSNLPRMLFYAGGTLTNELKLHSARHAELLLKATISHIDQIETMLKDCSINLPNLYAEISGELGTAKGLQDWLQKEENMDFHDACVADIKKIIHDDIQMARKQWIKPTQFIEQ